MKRLMLITLALATLCTSNLYAGGRPGNEPCDGPCNKPACEPREGGGHFLERMSRILDLSPAQQESIAVVQAAEQEKSAALHDKKEEIRRQLRQAESAQPFDENAVKALAEERGAIEAELTLIRARTHSQINALLTPEQRELAAKLRPEPGEKHKGGRR